MDTENNAMGTRTRLHPLLTAAAISVTVFSVAGVGALTGLLPTSLGSQKQATPLQEDNSLQIPAEVAKPVEPAITHPVPARKSPAKRTAATPRASTPVAYNNEFGQEPRLAQAETPKPVVQPGNLATIQAVREVKDPGQHTGLGPIAGGIAGAVLGDQIGKGKDTTRKVLTVLGAAGGAYAGREIEKQARATKHWEIDVRRDDGLQETVRSDVAPPYQPGQRVRLLDGRLQPA
jgi:outer membrane lipoprotein SlyB